MLDSISQSVVYPPRFFLSLSLSLSLSLYLHICVYIEIYKDIPVQVFQSMLSIQLLYLYIVSLHSGTVMFERRSINLSCSRSSFALYPQYELVP